MRTTPTATSLALLAALAACSPGGEPGATEDASTGEPAPSTGAPTTGEPTTGGPDGSTGEPTTGEGSSTGEPGGWPSPEDAPRYDGDAFTGMQIYDVARALWIDEETLLAGLDPASVVYVGEQHTSAPVHELQLWLLTRMLARHDDVALGMEHFERDVQGLLDDYLAGAIDGATFEAGADPWDDYALYWKPLVEATKAAGRPVLALNVPTEALSALYADFPARPLDLFNAWDEGSPHHADLPPRPLPEYDALYEAYFAASYDYESHGKDWGLSYEAALQYFADLAWIRDDTMGYWLAQHLEESGGRVVVVAGDWHVQTGIATPDSASRHADAPARLITTATLAGFEKVRSSGFMDRPVADYIFVYAPG